MKHPLPALLLALLCALPMAPLGAWPTPRDDQPPRDVRLVEKKPGEIASQDENAYGKLAAEIAPAKWKFAETEHFIFHYRRATEAQRAVREIEYTLWFVARSLGARPEQYAKKSHVYIFANENEWRTFLMEIKNAGDASGMMDWVASFAHGDDLFLHVGGMGEAFDSQLLAHETTHAVVARLYPQARWPRWLNEGFAEYMGTASVAARTSQWAKGMQRVLEKGNLPLETLTTSTDYPANREAVRAFYQSSERLIRFLMSEFPKERFPQFVEAVLAGSPFPEAVVKIYGDKVKDYADFSRKYDRFVK